MATREAEAAEEAGGGRILMEAGQFVCPECGRKFGRAQALGAHRRRAHNVQGTSSGASRGRAQRAGRKSKTKTATKTRTAGKTRTRKTAKTRSIGIGAAIAAVPVTKAAAINGRKARKTTARKRGPYKRRSATRRTAAQANGAVDKNALLGTVFPNGLPNNAEAIRRTVVWLEEAEALAKL